MPGSRPALGQPPRYLDCVRVPAARMPVDIGAARIREPQKPGDLVKTLAGSIIKGSADDRNGTRYIAYMKQRSMAA